MAMRNAEATGTEGWMPHWWDAKDADAQVRLRSVVMKHLSCHFSSAQCCFYALHSVPLLTTAPPRIQWPMCEKELAVAVYCISIHSFVPHVWLQVLRVWVLLMLLCCALKTLLHSEPPSYFYPCLNSLSFLLLLIFVLPLFLHSSFLSVLNSVDIFVFSVLSS